MATVKGVNRTLADTPTPANRIAAGQVDGRIKCMVDTYEAAAIAIGTVIQMGDKLQVGSRIREIILHTDDLTNNTTLQVGDAEDPNRYITATDHGGGSETITRLNAIAGRNYVIDETDSDNTDRQIIITTAAGIATGTIKLEIYYSRD